MLIYYSKDRPKIFRYIVSHNLPFVKKNPNDLALNIDIFFLKSVYIVQNTFSQKDK